MLAFQGDYSSPKPKKTRRQQFSERFTYLLPQRKASLVAQMVKNPPTMQETQVQSLGQKDPLEKEMETHSSILSWKIPMDRGAW